MADGFAEDAAERAVVKEDKEDFKDGLVLEHTAARRLAPHICQELRLTRPRVLKSLYMNFPESLSDTLYDAAEEGRISTEDATAVLLADFIMSGASRDPET